MSSPTSDDTSSNDDWKRVQELAKLGATSDALPAEQKLTILEAIKPYISDSEYRLMLKAFLEKFDGDASEILMPHDPPSDLKCWICYDGYNPEVEGPDWHKTWRRVCPCNLFAHERCLYKWVASSSLSDAPNPCCCPQCKEPVLMNSKKSLTLTARDTVEDLLADISSIAVVAGICGCAGSAIYLTLYPVGSWVIRILCSPDLASYLLGQTIVPGETENESLVKLDFNTRTIVSPFLVPLALLAAPIDDFYVNTILTVTPLLFWKPRILLGMVPSTFDTFLWPRLKSYFFPDTSTSIPIKSIAVPSFTAEKVALTLYPLVRLGYFFLYKRYVTPIMRKWVDKMLIVKPSSQPRTFGFNLVFEDENGIQEEIIQDDEREDNQVRMDNIGENNGAEPGEDQNQNDNDDDFYTWAIARQRRFLQIFYLLAWPFVSSHLSRFLFSLPMFTSPSSKLSFLVPSSELNRNLLASMLVIVGRDVVNWLTLYLRYRVDQSSSVINYFDKNPVGFFNRLKVWTL